MGLRGMEKIKAKVDGFKEDNEEKGQAKESRLMRDGRRGRG